MQAVTRLIFLAALLASVPAAASVEIPADNRYGVCYHDTKCGGGGRTDLYGVCKKWATNPVPRHTWDGTAGDKVPRKSWLARDFDGSLICCSWKYGEHCETSDYSGTFNIPLFAGGWAGGDPHFKLWHGHRYDFHGQCDLVMVSAKSFQGGQGLQVHIRTRLENFYSFIEQVAIKIGEDTLQVAGDGVVFFNDRAIGNDLTTDLPAEVSSSPLSFHKDAQATHYYDITIGPNEGKIRIKTWREMVWVDIDEVTSQDFGDAMGLLGNFTTGQMAARDGETIFEDPDDFGNEWQVRESDGALFQINRAPQYPQACDMPDASDKSRRRLGDTIPGLEEAAKQSCAHWGSGTDACIYDVMATGVLALAQVGTY